MKSREPSPRAFPLPYLRRRTHLNGRNGGWNISPAKSRGKMQAMWPILRVCSTLFLPQPIPLTTVSLPSRD